MQHMDSRTLDEHKHMETINTQEVSCYSGELWRFHEILDTESFDFAALTNQILMPALFVVTERNE